MGTTAGAAVLSLFAFVSPGKERSIDLESVRVPADSQRIAATWSQISRARGVIGPPDTSVRTGRHRGPALKAYPAVAPGVVLVRTVWGHGAGFLVDPDGWIITNHHVIANAETDLATGSLVATIHYGHLGGGRMHLVESGLPAFLHKQDEEKDLALLKLQGTPSQPLPALIVATENPDPGADCVVFGHPETATLWTARSCEVIGEGEWPRDRTVERIRSLAVESSPAPGPPTARRKVLLSSCDVSQGDSGGPLVDARHQVIGVSFGASASSEVSYHIHREELDEFLAGKPERPLLHVPDPWAPATFNSVKDMDNDKKFDTLFLVLDRQEPPSGVLLDLDQDSNEPPAGGRSAGWDFEVVIQRVPERRVFYDTDNDGQVDLVLNDRDGDGKADLTLELDAGTWKLGTASGHDLLDDTLIPGARLQERFRAILDLL